jgi:hypothetical protein
MSERPRLYQRRVPSTILRDAVEVFRDDVDYLYLESETTIELIDYQTPDPIWTHGRAFGPKLEVRWQQAGDCFDLLLLTEADIQLPKGWQAVPQNDKVLPHPDSADPPGQILLWGTHVSRLERPHHLAGGEGNVWIETRIPRPLKYPVSGAPPRVCARVIVYRYQGRPVLTRLVCLEGEENEPQPLW